MLCPIGATSIGKTRYIDLVKFLVNIKHIKTSCSWRDSRGCRHATNVISDVRDVSPNPRQHVIGCGGRGGNWINVGEGPRRCMALLTGLPRRASVVVISHCRPTTGHGSRCFFIWFICCNRYWIGDRRPEGAATLGNFAVKPFMQSMLSVPCRRLYIRETEKRAICRRASCNSKSCVCKREFRFLQNVKLLPHSSFSCMHYIIN